MMKNQCKKICSLILIMTMLLSVFSVTAGAVEESPMTISVSSSSGAVGQEVEVFINVKNNPGINSMSLSVSFESELTLKSVEYNKSFDGTAMKPEKLSSPVTLAWANPLENCNENGTFAKLRFMINKNVQGNSETSIKLDFDPENIYNVEEKNIPTVVENGTVKIYPNIPGDVNADGKQNNKDFTRLFQWLSGWNVVINQAVADVNNDGKISNKDATRLFQWLSDWDVEIFLDGQGYKKCQHSLEEIAAKAAACTEKGNIAYWHCTKCGKYFGDKNGIAEITLDGTVIEAKGHSLEAHAAKQPTTTSEGNIAYWYCTECKKYFSDSKGTQEIFQKDTVIQKLKEHEYTITYVMDSNDDYLKKQNIKNNPENPNTYTAEKGVPEFYPIEVEGYNFAGWFTTQTGGTQVTDIPKGTTGNKTLYAHWTKEKYKVTFDSPLVPVEDKERTIDQTTTLPDLSDSMYGYKFMGWTRYGEIVSIVEPGTKNITLHANWTSERNQSIPNDYEKEGGVVIDDEKNGQIIFIYNVGSITNVPLSVIEDMGNSAGIVIEKEYSKSTSISEGMENAINETVANATTRSSSWAFSKNWNESITDSEGKELTDTKNTSVMISNGSSSAYTENHNTALSLSQEAGKTNGTSSKTINTESEMKSIGLESGFMHEHTHETSTTKNQSFNIGLNFGSKLGAGVSGPLGSSGLTGDVSGESSRGLNLGYSNGRTKTTTDSTTNSFSLNLSTNLEESKSRTDEELKSKETSVKNTVGVNTESGFTKSSTSTHDESVTNEISNSISQNWDHSVSKSIGGSSSESTSETVSKETTKGYANTFIYNTEENNTVVKKFSNAGAPKAWYRVVSAGTVHVYAVVSYDIADKEYYFNTYSVLDDKTYDFVDVSRVSHDFNDYENAVLPFKVPYDVAEFVAEATSYSQGLEVDRETGMITGYNGSDEVVWIPDYVSIDNNNGTNSAVKVKGIAPGAFADNKKISGVRLSSFITKIPSNAFTNCTSLKSIMGTGVTSIGSNAFSGCTSLENVVFGAVTSIGNRAFNNCISLNSFSVGSEVGKTTGNTTGIIGTDAFKNVKSVTVNVRNSAIAESAVQCGAKELILNIGFDNNKISNVELKANNISEKLVINGGGKVFTNVSIVSDAKATVINQMTFADNIKVPLHLSSDNVVLNQVNIKNAANVCMALSSYNAKVALQGKNTFTSNGNYPVLTRSLTLSKMPNVIETTNLSVSGTNDKNIYVCGKVSDSDRLLANNSNCKIIEDDEYNRIFNSMDSIQISLNANGGTLSKSSIIVYNGQTYGELQNVSATRDYHNFDGWYTQSSGGIKITSSSIFTDDSNTTLYAHWTQKQPSGWVLASNVPLGAMIKDTKWTYDLTTTTTSSNNSLAGYTLYNTTWRWSDYGAWSGWQRDAVSGSDSRQVNTRYIEPTYKTQYNYNRWINNSKSNWGPCAGTWSGVYCGNYEERGWSDEPLPCTSDPIWSGQLGGYFRMYGYNKDLWYNETTRQVQTGGGYTEYQYRDRYQIYTYYFKKVESKESSTEVRTSDSISNVNKWVRYIEK